MRLKDLLNLIDNDSYLIISDTDGLDRIEVDPTNSFLKLFENVEINKIYTENLHICLGEIKECPYI